LRHKHSRIYKNFEKGASYWTDWTDPHKKVCHAHLHFIEIMCSKDYLDGLKLCEDFETQHITNRPSTESPIDQPSANSSIPH